MFFPCIRGKHFRAYWNYFQTETPPSILNGFILGKWVPGSSLIRRVMKTFQFLLNIGRPDPIMFQTDLLLHQIALVGNIVCRLYAVDRLNNLGQSLRTSRFDFNLFEKSFDK